MAPTTDLNLLALNLLDLLALDLLALALARRTSWTS
jgi:hypothetical protein